MGIDKEMAGMDDEISHELSKKSEEEEVAYCDICDAFFPFEKEGDYCEDCGMSLTTVYISNCPVVSGSECKDDDHHHGIGRHVEHFTETG